MTAEQISAVKKKDLQNVRRIRIMNKKISDDITQTSDTRLTHQHQTFCKTLNSQDVHQYNTISSNKSQSHIKNDIQPIHINKTCNLDDLDTGLSHLLNVQHRPIHGFQHWKHPANVHGMGVCQSLMPYMVFDTSPFMAYQQINQFDGRTTCMPTVMNSLQDIPRFSPYDAHRASMFSSRSSVIKQRDCNSKNVSSLDVSRNWMSSLNKESNFSQLLADCLSHVSLDRFPDAVDGVKAARTLLVQAKIDSTLPPTCDTFQGQGNAKANCDKVNRCYVCLKTFCDSKSLQSHMKRHFSLPHFTCSECNKSFYELSVLKKHKRIHSKSKPYPCAICGSRFNQKSNMIRHHKMHLKPSRK